MAENNFYKFVASVVAIFTYLLLIYSIVSYIQSSPKLKKDYGFNVEDAIVVNIDSLIKDKPKPVEKLEPKPIAQPVIKEIVTPPAPIIEPIVEEEEETKHTVPPIIEPFDEEQPEKQSRDLQAKSAKDLFSTVRTDEYTKAMDEKQKQEEARASRLKKQKAEAARKRAAAKRAKERKQRQKAKELVQQMQISNPSEHKKSGEYQEFWSNVSNIIMGEWQKTIATHDGISATVVVRIDSQGRFSYNRLTSSGNSLFDTKLKTFLDNLEYKTFYKYKYGSYIEAEFEFKDKERGI
jgi:type IV secretory pathway VirB10-like protein